MFHTPITEDPDVRAAVEAFRDHVLRIRAHSATLIDLPARRTVERAAEQAAIEELVADLQTRADRLAISLDDLFRFINDDLRATPPAADHRPTGHHLRVLEAEAIRAGASERRAHDEVTRAQDQLRNAIAARLAAQRACAGYVADMVGR